MSTGGDRPLEQRLRELETLADSVRTLTATLELPEVLRSVLARIKRVTRAEALSLLLYDAERDELVFAATETLRENLVAGVRVPVAQSIAGWVARTGESAIVNEASHDPRFYPDVDRITHFGTRNLLAVPLRKGDRLVGVVEIANRYDGGDFDERDRERLEAVASTLGAAAEPETLAHDNEAMRRFLAAIAAAVPAEAASLLLYDPDGHELVFNASRTLQPGVIDGMRIPCSEGIAGWVARHRQSVRIDDVRSDPRHSPAIGQRIEFEPRSMIAAPIVSKGKLWGVIQVINRIGGHAFDDEELRMTEILADAAAIAIENASLYRQAYVASITDDLTGLGNTRYFNRLLPELLDRSQPLSLLVLDLDNFKGLVDVCGHLAGSRTIGHFGRKIASLLRPGDVAARFGGDEFVILLPKTETAAAREVAERIREAVAATALIEDLDVDATAVTASVGVATAPDHASEPEELFHAADAAMYAVKRSGKNGVGVAEKRGHS